MTHEQIEAVAQAIHGVHSNRSRRARHWEEIPERLKRDFREEAVAALRLMELWYGPANEIEPPGAGALPVRDVGHI